MGQRTRLAITSGEPAGVGPDLLVALAQRTRRAQWLVFGDADLLRRAAARLKLPLEIDADVENPSRDPAVLTVHHLALPVRERPGVLDVNNAGYVVRMLEAATDHCVAGSCQALVTAPVQKSIINEAGIPFTGHTEFFRDRAGVSDVVMLLVAGNLRVALATTHVPLKDVAAALTREVLTQTLEILLRGLEGSFGIRRPRVLVAGLNPHAGEGGHLGREEIDTITPVLDAFRARGARLRGPLPADTLFTPRQLAGADAVLAMYHDQGLPVLKYQGFGEAVNVTLGLPFVRTSVDHGTALDLAGTGRADSGSLQAALDLAERLVMNPPAPSGRGG